MPEKEPPSAYGLRMTASDGMVTYFYDEKYHAYAQTGKQKITLFSTKPKAKVVRAMQNRLNLDWYELVAIIFVEDGIEIYDDK